MNTMNTPSPRTQFTATRGHSMAAQHACPSSILAGRSCDALGVCQGRQPACVGCHVNAYNFAPGTIEFGAKKMMSLRKTLAVAAVLGLSLGMVGRWMGWI